MQLTIVPLKPIPFGQDDQIGLARPVEEETPHWPYALSTQPVSAAQWARFTEITGYVSQGSPLETWDWGWARVGPDTTFLPLASDHPVVGVSHADALAFCAWASACCGAEVRLPSELEFEHAARGGCTCHRFCGAAKAVRDQLRCYGDNATRHPPRMSQAGINAIGLRGMHGFIWHWCSDGVAPNGAIRGDRPGARWHGKPLARGGYIIRGGSFAYPPDFARCAARNASHEDDRNFSLGFRIALDKIPGFERARMTLLELGD